MLQHVALLRVATDLSMKKISLDIRVMEHGGDGAWRTTGAQGMATQRGTATQRGMGRTRGRARSIRIG